MKYKTSHVSLAVVALLAINLPLNASAGAKKSASPSPETSASPVASATASPAARTERAFPFHGMILAVDAKAKTLTIAGKRKSRVFKITDKTVFTKAGNPAKMSDVVADEEARGSYWKHADGTLEARNVKLGPLTQQEKAAMQARRQKRAERKDKAAGSPAPSASARP